MYITQYESTCLACRRIQQQSPGPAVQGSLVEGTVKDHNPGRLWRAPVSWVDNIDLYELMARFKLRPHVPAGLHLTTFCVALLCLQSKGAGQVVKLGSRVEVSKSTRG